MPVFFYFILSFRFFPIPQCSAVWHHSIPVHKSMYVWVVMLRQSNSWVNVGQWHAYRCYFDYSRQWKTNLPNLQFLWDIKSTNRYVCRSILCRLHNHLTKFQSYMLCTQTLFTVSSQHICTATMSIELIVWLRLA